MGKELNLINIYHMGRDDMQELRRQIEGHGKTLSVVTHGWHEYRGGYGPYFPRYDSPDTYKTARDVFIKGAVRQGHPLLFLDDRGERILRQSLPNKGVVFHAQTKPYDPTPSAGNTWQKIFDILYETGTLSADVGGLRYNRVRVNGLPKGATVEFPNLQGDPVPLPENWYELLYQTDLRIGEHHACNLDLLRNKQWLSPDEIPVHCVGHTILAFHLGGFDTSVSKVTAP